MIFLNDIDFAACNNSLLFFKYFLLYTFINLISCILVKFYPSCTVPVLKISCLKDSLSGPIEKHGPRAQWDCGSLRGGAGLWVC